MNPNGKKAVILLSGGIDSATLLFLAKETGYDPLALIFDYGQKHKKEIKFAEKLAGYAGSQYYKLRIKIPWSVSSLTDPSCEIPAGGNDSSLPSTYVPARNIIFLSYGISCAESNGAAAVFIGAHTQDYPGYPDCRPEFLGRFAQAVNFGIAGSKVEIRYPLIDKNKKDIIEMGLKLGVPFRYTWSCYQGRRHPCRECDSCRFRISAFDELGIKDPLLKNK